MVTTTERRRIREVQRLAEKAEPLREFGERGPGRGHTAHGPKQPRPTGMTKAYLVGRIARDHPDILDRMKAGDFSTVRQAAIAAGILQHPTRLDHFQKLWRNASDEEREAIAVDIMGWLLCQDEARYDAIRNKAAKRLEG
jgi:hypothetical protein